MKRLVIATIALVLAAPAASASGHSTLRGKSHVRATWKSRESGQPVIDWNQSLLSIVNTPGAQPAEHSADLELRGAARRDLRRGRLDRPLVRALRDQRARASRRIRDRGGRRRRAQRARRPLSRSAERARCRVRGRAVPGSGRSGKGRRRSRRRAGRPRPPGRSAPTTARTSRRRPFVPGANPGSYAPTPPNFPAPVFSTWGQSRRSCSRAATSSGPHRRPH